MLTPPAAVAPAARRRPAGGRRADGRGPAGPRAATGGRRQRARSTSAPTKGPSPSSTKRPRRSRARFRSASASRSAMTLSDDWSRLYVRDATFEKVEIFDRLKGTSLGTFTLTEGKAKTRIWGMRPDPQRQVPDPHDQEVHAARRTAGSSGRRRSCSTTWREKKITRTIPWPKGEEREGRGRAVLAGRQADVHVRRGHPDLRDRERSPKWIAGKCRARSSPAPASSRSAA